MPPMPVKPKFSPVSLRDRDHVVIAQFFAAARQSSSVKGKRRGWGYPSGIPGAPGARRPNRKG